jgi:hypothetical protein
MKTLFKIWWLKASIRNLKNKRRNAILDIAVRQPKEANRVNEIEDVNPTYFKSIDDEIQAREKLLSTISNNSLKSYRSITETKP